MSYYDDSPFKPEIDQAACEDKTRLIVCTDQQDANAAESIGFPNTSVILARPTEWRKPYGELFGGFDVILLPKNNDKGKKFAERFDRDTKKYCSYVKALYLSESVGGGVSEWVAKGNGAAQLLELLMKKKESEAVPLLIAAKDVPYSPPRWLIAPYFQRGKCTMIQGDNGTGKTAFACAVAACVSSGVPLYESSVETPGNVLILSVEDDLEILRGRIEADGGDLEKCFFMPKASEMSFTSPEVAAAIKHIEARFVLFDPIQAFLGASVDMYRANETRPVLAALNELAEKNDCCICIIAHAVKSRGDKSPVNFALGSVDIPGAMRSIFHVTQDPENNKKRIAIHVKSSNAPHGKSLSYEIGDRGGVRFDGYSDIGRDDLIWIEKRKEKEQAGVDYDTEPLVQVFRQIVTDRPGGGFISYADLKSEGMKILGFPPFGKPSDLKAKLDTNFCRELQEKDGLIVTCGVTGKQNSRGIRIEQYKVPAAYQGKLFENG